MCHFKQWFTRSVDAAAAEPWFRQHFKWTESVFPLDEHGFTDGEPQHFDAVRRDFVSFYSFEINEKKNLQMYKKSLHKSIIFSF